MNLERMFREPQITERPLHMLVYGLAKTGKSHLVFTATDVGPLYWQDSEGGADLYPGDHGYGFRVLTSKDPWKTIEAVEAASKIVKEGEPRPIIAVDSMSSVWFQQKEVAQQMGGNRRKTPFWAWGPAKAPLNKLYELMHTARCHIIITARAKVNYEVSESGEPTEKGLAPDIERNLPFAVDLVVRTHVAEIEGGDLKPEDFMATVTGTRSASVDGEQPAIPIGRTFQDPKFSDFLDAMVEGAMPEGIEDTTMEQAKQPRTWGDLATWIEGQDNLTVETSKKDLVEEFGSFDKERVPEYYRFLKEKVE